MNKNAIPTAENLPFSNELEACGYVFDAAACFDPRMQIPAMFINIVNGIIGNRNLKRFGEALQTTQNAVFNYEKLTDEQQSIMLINVNKVLSDVLKTVQLKKVDCFAKMVSTGIKEGTIYSDEETFQDYETILNDLPNSAISFLAFLDQKTKHDEKGSQIPFRLSKENYSSVIEAKQFQIQKTISLGLLNKDTATFDNGTINLDSEVYYLSPLYFKFREYIILASENGLKQDQS